MNKQSAQFVPEDRTEQHFFANGELIYSDKIAKFIIRCEEATAQRVTGRLRQVYTDLFIDEFQDSAG